MQRLSRARFATRLAAFAPPLSTSSLLFSLNSFAGSMLALFVAFSLGLPRPYWAMTTAYIVSQPLAGAAASKAVYRLIGTVVGGAATVALVPNLVQAPFLLCLALALWVGGCLAVSLLDRTPRSYAAMLSGYTAAIIGFSLVNRPEDAFDVAVNRVEEIGLGVICAGLMHTLVFPRPVRAAILTRVSEWLAEADRWALDVLEGAGGRESARDRRHLAAAAVDIQLLSIHLPFDTSRAPETRAAVRALHERMLLLIPLLSGLSDRLGALRRERPGAPLPPEGLAALQDLARWIEAGCDFGAVEALDARLAELRAQAPDGTWPGLVAESLWVRLRQIVEQLAGAHTLLERVRDPGAPAPPEVHAHMTRAAGRSPRGDPGLAVWSGATAATSVLVVCTLWIGLGWPEGGGAAAMVAVFASFFAAIDDPAPAIANFGVFLVAGIPLAAYYEFVVLPRVNSFAILVAALAPPLVWLGLYSVAPKRAGAITAVILGFSGALALQESLQSDFANFINANLPQIVALFVAIFVTRAMRSMSVEASARRLLHRSWRDVADIARGRAAVDPLSFAARLVDNVGLITPKLAELESDGGGGADVLRDLRVGMNLYDLQRVRPALAAEPREALEALLQEIAAHYAERPQEPWSVRPELLAALDRLLAALARSPAPADRDGAAALVGLRRGLFPGGGAPQTLGEAQA